MVIELTDAQEQQLASLASETHLSVQDMVNDLVSRFLQSTAESKALLARADEQVGQGRVLTHAEVGDRLEQRMRSR